MLRRGFTLIELMVVLTVGTVIVGIGVGTLHVLLRTEQTGRDRVPQAGVLARLAAQFRSDVNAAVRQTAGEHRAEWRFALTEDRLVAYRALPGELRREEHVAGKLVRQETYVLPGGSSATIAVESKAAPPVASLVIVGGGPPSAIGRQWRVTAVLGKDHRFTKLPVGSQ